MPDGTENLISFVELRFVQNDEQLPVICFDIQVHRRIPMNCIEITIIQICYTLSNMKVRNRRRREGLQCLLLLLLC